MIKRLENDDQYFLLKSNNYKYGYVNKQGKELTNAIFISAEKFNNSYAWANFEDEKVLVNQYGQIINPGVKLSRTTDVSEEYASVKVRKGWLIIDTNGEEMSDEVFKAVRSFKNGTAAVRTRKGWSIVDTKSNHLIDSRHDNFEAENANTIVFSDAKKIYFYSREGKEYKKINAKGKVSALGEYYFTVERGGNKFIYRNNGELYKNKKFRKGLMCSGDSIFSINSARVVLWSSEAKRILSVRHYGGEKAFEKGSLKMERNTAKDKMITMKVYPSHVILNSDVYSDSVDRIEVRKPPYAYKMKLNNYKIADCIRNNAFVIGINDGTGGYYYHLIDSLGNLLIDERFKSLEYLQDDLYKATVINDQNQLVKGVINKDGIWVIEPKFRDITTFTNGVARYAKNADYWIAGQDGQLINPQAMIEYSYRGGYYCMYSDDRIAWWHPSNGWLINFSK
ncbi:MAG: WG repeat-containing protein [Bacteroidia bacterium]